ncbi:MAG: hypothetical protein QGH66_03755 [Dehalococcoidia bacterium]|nr:hypothetical protein [Dehalococcoidia bacterium]MDP7240009.1 hypothetical protein [Dehalococcoidia bacterium]MDP7470652.1 hypothetical protein [Dehalococcoidia bacterium]
MEVRAGHSLPACAHTAVRQPRIVSRNIVAGPTEGDKRAFKTPLAADLVSMGSHLAPVKLPLIRLYGSPAKVL